jgi:hypothetical protein
MEDVSPHVASSLQDFDDNEHSMTTFPIPRVLSSRGQTSSSRGQTSSSRGPQCMFRIANQPTHGISIYVYCNEELMQDRPMNKPLTTCDSNDDLLLQTLSKEWICTSKAYFEALEEKQIKVSCLQG